MRYYYFGGYNMKRIVIGLLLSISLFFPGYASAHWEDDSFNETGMDTTKWFLVTWPTSSNVVFEENGNGNLAFYTNGAISSHSEIRYFSNWYFDTSNSFRFQVDSYLNYQGQGNSGLYAGVVNLPHGSSSSDVFGASNVNLSNNIPAYHAQYWSNLEGDFTTISAVNHNYNRVRFIASYDNNSNNLLYQMFPLDNTGNIIPGVSFEQIVETDLNNYGDYWRVILAGTTEAGQQVPLGEAYFEDFKVLDNTVVPEPSSLLLLSFGLLGARLYRKKHIVS